MRREQCKHKEKDGHEKPCVNCVECGVPYVEGTAVTLRDYFEDGGIVMKEKIKIICYGKAEYWDDREKAKAFYFDCMINSEGAERDRYVNIYTQLCLGHIECMDE